MAVAACACSRVLKAAELVSVARDLLTLLWPQYVCVGYALYDEEKLRQQREEAKKSPTAPVELPYCEGEQPNSHFPCHQCFKGPLMLVAR